MVERTIVLSTSLFSFMNKLIIHCIVIILSFSSFKTLGQLNGGLIITPKRVVFEGRQTKKIITLINSSDETSTYTVSFTENRMNEDGSFTSITAPDIGQLFASPYIRIYPRQVTLNPGETQSVMLQHRRMSNVKTGEYRSHLYFRTEKNKTLLGEDKKKDSIEVFSVNITPIFGISIPVIIRSVGLSVTTTISDIKLHNIESPKLTFILHRKGNRSIYGDIAVTYYPIKGKSFKIAALKGVGLYTTIEKRFMSLKLKGLSEINLKEGSIKIEFTSRPGNKKQESYAEAELLLTD
tara:strand:+ start:725 stop:1606 length:882 start_codon:yes stop_codon:yes gene_type:complete